MTWLYVPDLILDFCPANQRRCYKVTPSLIDWMQAYNHPCLRMVPQSIGGTPVVLGIPYDCPGATEATLQNIGKCIKWIRDEPMTSPQQNKAQENHKHIRRIYSNNLCRRVRRPGSSRESIFHGSL